MISSELIVGFHAVEALVRSNPQQIDRILFVRTRQDKRQQSLLELARAQGIKLEQKERAQLHELCGHEKHQGVLAFFNGTLEKNESFLRSDLLARARPWLIMVLDRVQDPHNLGACLRCADAFAADAVIVPRDKSTGITASVQKVAAGAASSVPFYRVTNLARVLRQLKQDDAWVFGADAQSTTSLYDINFSGSVVLVLGAEGAGLRQNTQRACDQLYKIPLHGSVSSLNVSVAAGISLSEVVRQRDLIDNH